MLDLAAAFHQLRPSAKRHRNPVDREIVRAIRAVLDTRPIANHLDPVGLNEIHVAALAERISKSAAQLAAAMSRDDISRRLLNGVPEEVVRVAQTLLYEVSGHGDHWTASWLLPPTVTVGEKHATEHRFPIRDSMHDLIGQLRQFSQQLCGRNGPTILRKDPFRLYGFRRVDWYLPQAPGWLPFNRKYAAWRGFNARIPDAIFELHWPKFAQAVAPLSKRLKQLADEPPDPGQRWLLVAVIPAQTAALIAAATAFLDALIDDLEKAVSASLDEKLPGVLS